MLGRWIVWFFGLGGNCEFTNKFEGTSSKYDPT